MHKYACESARVRVCALCFYCTCAVERRQVAAGQFDWFCCCACQVAQFGQVDGASCLQVALILKRALRKRKIQAAKARQRQIIFYYL